MGALLLKLKLWWETADRTQRTVTVFGSALLVALIVGTALFAGRPQMQLLFSGLSPADQGVVVNELASLGIPVQHDANGNISVPSSDVARARAQLAVNKKLPASGMNGDESLAAINLSTTPRVEAERIKASVEAELARSLSQLEGVAAARVHLNLGESSPFARDNRPPSASVVITESTGLGLGAEGARAAQRLVQYAVTGLDARHITIINSRGQVLVDGDDEGGAAGVASDRIAAQNGEARRRELDLQRKLDSAFGMGSTVVSIPVLELNWDQQSEKRTEREPTKNPVVVEQNKETMAAATPIPAGPAGTQTNLQPAEPATAGEDGKRYEGEQKSQSFTMNETLTTTERAAGNITRLAVNVLADTARLDSPEKVEAVRTFVQAAVAPWGVDAEGGENAAFAATVTPIEFDTRAAADAEAAAATAASAARMQQMLSLLPIAALLIVGFLVVKALGKAAGAGGAASMAALPGGGVVALPGGGYAAHPAGQAALGHAAGALEGYHPDQIHYPEGGGTPMVRNEDGDLIPIDTEGVQQAILINRGKIVPETIDVIPDKINVPLEQIRLLANERPQVVAALLKSWMLEDRR